MTITQLKTFLTVCRCMSFTLAAQRLFLSQPAVSRQMAALERELGTPLFERTRNQLQLTAAGEHLSRRLAPLLVQLDGLLDQTRRIGDGLEGELCIGLLEDQSLDAAFEGALRALQAQRRVRLTIRRLDFRALENALRAEDIHLAVSLLQGPSAFLHCARRVYAREPMCLALRRGLLPDPPACLDSKQLSRLPVPLLVPSLDSFQESQYPELCALMDRGRLERQEYDFSSIAPMVSAGLACTIANRSHCLSVDQSVVLIPVSDIPPVGKCVFWLTEGRNPMVETFLSGLDAAPAP